MANIIQRLFYKDYQCQILDMIKENAVHHRYDEWTNFDGNNARSTEESYSIRDKKFFICVTRSYEPMHRPVSFRLYMEDNRPASPIPYQATQLNTKFAEKVYYQMLSKYQDTHNVR